MHSSLLCKLCNEPFNTTSKAPRLLPLCGHSICETCIITLLSQQKSINCPEGSELLNFHNQHINNYPINATLFGLINLNPFIGTFSVSNNSCTDRHSFPDRLPPDESDSDFNIFRNSPERLSNETSVINLSKNTKKTTKMGFIGTNDVCLIHNKKMKTVCLSENCLKVICSHCGLYGDHRVS